MSYNVGKYKAVKLYHRDLLMLIIITGYPSSGKTYRALQLVAALDETPHSPGRPPLKVRHILSHHSQSSDNLSVSKNPRDSIYTSAAQEKVARASEFTAIKRALGKDAIIIADGLNYIKGYRYQLWCEAKAAGVRCVTVHVVASEEDATRWNFQRLVRRGWASEDGGPEDLDSCSAMKGPMMPESHTAIYGDRGAKAEDVKESPLPMDFQPSLNPRDEPEPTLKSLYISDRQRDPDTDSDDMRSSNPHIQADQPLESSASLLSPPLPLIAHPDEPPYSPSTLTSLLMRYEPPSPFSRWDTPLFTVLPSDDSPPISEIRSAMFPSPSFTDARTKSKAALPEKIVPHAATVAPRSTPAEALQSIERRTSAVLNHLLTWAKEHGDEGGEVEVDISSTATFSPAPGNDEERLILRIPYGVNVNMAMGQRLRRQYIQIQRGALAHGKGVVGLGQGEIERAFVRFLEGEWNVDA
ncbi:MAG: hypothetical protein Q9227_003880 [Pyrenula ochraceoflavens]